MKTKITNEELFYFEIPGLVEKVVALIAKEFEMSPIEALDSFYDSSTYGKLEDKNTGLWKMKPKELFKDFLTSTKRLSQ